MSLIAESDLNGVQYVLGADDSNLAKAKEHLMTVVGDVQSTSLCGRFTDVSAQNAHALFDVPAAEFRQDNSRKPISSVSLQLLSDSGYSNLVAQILAYKFLYQDLIGSPAMLKIDAIGERFSSQQTGIWHRDPGRGALSAVAVYAFGEDVTGGEFNYVDANMSRHIKSNRRGVLELSNHLKLNKNAQSLPLGALGVFNRDCFHGLIHAGTPVHNGVRLRILMDPIR